ncbi:MAG TPA: hypothetical protein VL334_10725 [Anaerolineae bacterium]|nr:hypothetical protein [Anaerolineae bacterium]
MNQRFLTLTLGLLLPLLLLVALGAATATAEPVNTLTRQRDVVVINGAALPALAGAPLDEIFVYRFDGAAWQQIPFQFDEVDPVSSSYVLTGDGALDPADELAFVAQDAGQQAPAGQWITDPLSTAYPRYELLVSDPVHPGETAWAYVYRSPTLSPAFGPPYIGVTTDTITTPFFAATVNFSETLGLTGLELNGSGQDIVDQSHLSIKGRIVFLPVQLCEADILSQISDPSLLPSGLPPGDRPVRYVSGPADGSGSAVTPASLRTVVGPVDLSAIAGSIGIPGLTLDEFRISLDLLNPAVSGFAPARFHANTIAAAGVPIDGVPDSVPTTLSAWTQLNGSHGSIVQLNSVQTTGTSAFTYYLDNANATAADCHGTDGAYGESGIRVAPFAGQVTISQHLYFAEPLSQAAGALYQSYAANPLQAAAASQLTCFFADLHPDAAHTDPTLCDDDVDVADIQRVAGCWNQPPGTAACPARLDVDGDNAITTADITAVAQNWGWQR